jgi:hypothetical protein
MPNGKVEIVGLEKLQKMLNTLAPELKPPILREIARKPAQRAAAIARKIFPYGDKGGTVRSIGTLKVKNGKQTFVQVGFRGKSKGYIFISKDIISRRNRGTIKGTPWLFHRAGDLINASGKTEMKADISKVIARHFRKSGYKPTMRL